MSDNIQENEQGTAPEVSVPKSAKRWYAVTPTQAWKKCAPCSGGAY
jgi:hypothetical protein